MARFWLSIYEMRFLLAAAVLSLVSCGGQGKLPPGPPGHVSGHGSADAVSASAVVLGSLAYGQTRQGELRPDAYLAYELEGQAGDVVTLEVEAVSPGVDPVLFFYGPGPEGSELTLLAESDDVDYPTDLGSRIAGFRLEVGGAHLVVFRDYSGRGGLEYAVTAGCEAGPCAAEDTPAEGSALQAVVDRLGAECGTSSPGTVCGLSVRDLRSGASADWNGEEPFVSASSPKFIWVAAALRYGASVETVEPLAIPIFESSDNYATGQVIDLLPSPDAVNAFMYDAIGAEGSCFRHWNYGGTREASSCPEWADGVLGDDNFFTASDAALFLDRLWRGELLDEAATEAILDWSTHAPRSGYSGWIPSGLPEAAARTAHHKSGSLPPDTVPGYSVSHDIGLVELPGGGAYAVAILMSGGERFYDRQIRLIPYISCVLYHAVADDGPDPFAACEHP